MYYPDGRWEPSAIIWEGKALVIEDILHKELNLEDGKGEYDFGIKYTVRIEGKVTHIYKEGNRFFVMMKET